MSDFLPIIVIAVTIATMIGIIVYAFRRIIQRVRQGTDVITNISNMISQIQEQETCEPKSISGATAIYVPRIKRDFPDFHEPEAYNAIRIFIKEYLEIKHSKKDGFTESTVDKNLLFLIEKSSYSDISNISVHKMSISNYVKNDEYATITYQASVGFDTHGQRIETRYIIEYTLRLSNQNIATQALTCNNCGATIESTNILVCPYCNAKIIRDTVMNWVFTSITEK